MKYTNNENILTKQLDLGSLKSVRQFAQHILETEPNLDILINNAAIGNSSLESTEDGLNPTMQINYFGHFLLTHLLAPLLKKSAPSRVIFTSSCFAFLNNLQVNNLNNTVKREGYLLRKYQHLMTYDNSKLALLIASDIFSEKFKPYKVTSNSLHPGFVQTPILSKYFSLFNNNKIWDSLVALVLPIFAKNIWDGAQTTVHLAVSKKLDNVSGKFFWDCKLFPKPMSAYDKEFCGAIWRLSEQLVGLREHEKL